MLGLNREIHEAFQVDFCDRFARCSGLLVREFRNYLADFPRLREAEAAAARVVWLLNAKSVMH